MGIPKTATFNRYEDEDHYSWVLLPIFSTGLIRKNHNYNVTRLSFSIHLQAEGFGRGDESNGSFFNCSASSQFQCYSYQ